jgi:hypothetical protein
VRRYVSKLVQQYAALQPLTLVLKQFLVSTPQYPVAQSRQRTPSLVPAVRATLLPARSLGGGLGAGAARTWGAHERGNTPPGRSHGHKRIAWHVCRVARSEAGLWRAWDRLHWFASGSARAERPVHGRPLLVRPHTDGAAAAAQHTTHTTLVVFSCLVVCMQHCCITA